MNTQFSAMVNFKGGVGKTTTAVNFAALSARLLEPNRVLLIDTDYQANATNTFMGSAIAFGERQSDVYTLLDVLEGRTELAQAVHVIELDAVGDDYPATSFHIIPARFEMAALDMQLNTGYQNLFTLKEKAKSITNKYDLVIVDCPANFGGFFANALMLCSHLVIPVIPGEHESKGLSLLTQHIDSFKQANNDLKITGVLPTRVKRTNLARDHVQDLANVFGEELLLPSIADRVAVEEAHVNHKDILAYKPKSDSAAQYLEATKAFLVRIGLNGRS